MEGVVLRIATTKDQKHVDFLVSMINKVYIESEGNIWRDGHERITHQRLTEVIQNNELLLATMGDEICGCIHLEKMDTSSYKFKMLVANPKFKGKGIGSLLVNYAEEEAKSDGANMMQLELLDTTEFSHPDKVFLTNWYTRIGYQLISKHDVDVVHAGLSKLLKTGCCAKIYQKELIS